MVQWHIIEPSALRNENFDYRISGEENIKFLGVFVDKVLPQDRVVLCYHWTEEELKYYYEQFQKEFGYSIGIDRDIVTLRFFEEGMRGVVHTKTLDKTALLQWETFHLERAIPPQRLEYEILERVKQLRLEKTMPDYMTDNQLRELMENYMVKFGNPNIWHAKK